jgi:hypothetical protein
MNRTALQTVGAALVLAGLTGCATALTLDTARALPRGEERVLSYGGGGYQHGDQLRYRLPDLDDDALEGETQRLPLTAPVAIDYGMRASVGLGFGGQADFWGSAPLPVGLGVGLGLKWQLLGGAEGPVALAVNGRTNFSFGGTSSGDNSGTLWLWSSEGGLIVSLHLRPNRALYLAPRLRYDHFEARTTRGERKGSASAWATSAGGAVGVQLGRLFVEAVVLRTPPQSGSPDGGTLITGGVGVAQ